MAVPYRPCKYGARIVMGDATLNKTVCPKKKCAYGPRYPSAGVWDPIKKKYVWAKCPKRSKK